MRGWRPLRKGGRPSRVWAHAVLLLLFAAAAQPAAAREWIHSPNPAILYKSSLNNAQVFLAVDGDSPRHRTTSQLNANRSSWFTFSGVPSGVTLSISNVINHTITGVGEAARLTLSYSGNFSSDWVLTITVSASAYFVRARTVTYTIPVQTDNTKGLWTGAVSGQAAEDGSQATFPVRLRAAPSAAVTVSVSSRDASEGTVAPSSLTFETTDWSTVQTVTVTGVDDDVDDGTVTWQVRLDPSSGDTGYNGLTNVDVDVTTTDDDGTPGVTLALDPASVSENGGIATVTARLSHASGAATTVTVAAAPVASSGAVAGDFTLSTANTLTFAANATVSAGLVTVTAVDNTTDAPNRMATVTATVTNDRATADSTTMMVTGATLTLTDDDAAPGATLALNPASVSENAGVSTVTATLSRPSSEPSTVTVTAVSGSFTVGSDATITIAAGSTTAASDTVLITAVDDSIHQGTAGRSATVTAALANGQGAGAVTGAALALTDDEMLPTVALVLTPASISELSEVSTVTATLSGPSTEAVTVTVAAAAGMRAAPGDFALSTATTLTIAAGATTSAGVVTVTANEDTTATGSKQVTVSGTAAGGNSVANPANRTLTITDSDAPQTTLALSSGSIAENGGVATVTAMLDRQSSVAVTVTVAAMAGANAAAGDFTLSTPATLTFAANATTSAGLVTVTAVNDETDAPDKSVTVSGTASDSLGLTNDPPNVTLTLTDDDEKGLALAPAGPLFSEGGSVSYTAVLTSEPTEAVTVSISTDDANLTISPSRGLTFAPSEWDGPQTVTVTGIAGVAASELRHAASGGGYDGVAKNLWVAGSAAVDIRTTGNREEEEPPRIIFMNGQPVTVTKAAGVPPGVRVMPRRLPDGPLEVTFTPLTDEQAAAAAGSRYSLGPAESRVAVNVPSALGGGLLCLPVTDGLRAAAAGRTLILLRRGEPVAGSRQVPPDGEVIEVCATVQSFSPFAVGYEDTKPVLDRVSETPQCRYEDERLLRCEFTVGEAIEQVKLPLVTSGDGVTYRLSPALPDWVERSGLHDERLSGTPTAEMAVTPYTWTATDVDIDIDPEQQDELKFTIEVVPALDKARARLAAVNRSVLPELSRATWGSVVDAVTGRLESSGAGSGMADTLASALKAQEDAQEGEGLSWREVVEGRTFAVALGGGAGAGAGSGGGGVGGDGSGAAGAVMWGGGSRRSLSLDKESLDWSGDLFSAHVGVDAPLGEGLRGGLAMSWFEGEIDYTDRSGDEAVAGVHESRLTAVHPYAGWTGADGSRLWGALGYGEGEIEIADAEVRERFGVQKGDSAFVGVAAGGSVPVASADGLTLALKGSGEATRYSVKDNGSAIEGVSVKTQRLRLAAEGSRTWALTDGGTLTPSLEVGARWDGGDGETGAGVELGGGLEWVSDGLSVEARGRMLAAHEGDVEEWGVSGSARLSPGSGGRGLSLALSPRWGASESGLARLWDEGLTGGASSGADADTARLEAELGYGFGMWEGSGLATPHAGLGYGNDGARHWRLGTRFAFGPDVAVGLEAERREGAADPEHGAGLELRLRW